MKKTTWRVLALLLLLCITINIFALTSCDKTPGGSEDSSSAESSDGTETKNDFELTSPPDEVLAIIYMIRQDESLKGWDSGRSYDARYYVDDIVDILDALEWSDGESITISSDFHFKMTMLRTYSDLESYYKFFGEDSEDTSAETSNEGTEQTDNNANTLYTVEYLINNTDGTVKMRLTDDSNLSFDVFATLDEEQMTKLIAYLSYYFGPKN